MQAEPLSFYYTGSKADGKKHYGMLAEDLAELYPNNEALVQYNDKGEPTHIRYIETVPLLLKELQNQRVVIDQLYNENMWQQQEMQALWETIKELQEQYAVSAA